MEFEDSNRVHLLSRLLIVSPFRSSLLDCFRSSRSPGPASQGRGLEDFLQGGPAHRCLRPRLLHYSRFRSPPAQDHVQGVARGLQ